MMIWGILCVAGRMYDVDPESELQKDLDAQEHILNQDMEKIVFLAVYLLTVLAFLML